MKLSDSLTRRFGAHGLQALDRLEDNPFLRGLGMRGSARKFDRQPVEHELLRSLCALALCAPTKSDLQQRDIVIVNDKTLRAELNHLLAGQDWVPDAPSLLVFCGNNRRQRIVHEMRVRRFVNDHLDAFFNAAVDAGIALAAFVLAAESVGLGCCPLSAIRNRAAEVSRVLALPSHVFPVAGLGVGWPAEQASISLRLPLPTTVHIDRYGEDGLAEAIEAYDARRSKLQPYASQRFADEYGESGDYGWSEDKARQYSKPERADFGAYIRKIGFDLS